MVVCSFGFLIFDVQICRKDLHLESIQNKFWDFLNLLLHILKLLLVGLWEEHEPFPSTPPVNHLIRGEKKANLEPVSNYSYREYFKSYKHTYYKRRNFYYKVRLFLKMLWRLLRGFREMPLGVLWRKKRLKCTGLNSVCRKWISVQRFSKNRFSLLFTSSCDPLWQPFRLFRKGYESPVNVVMLLIK